MLLRWCSIFICSVGHLIIHCSAWSDTTIRKFPPNFLFGAATAAYQVEGGWNADGKGESIWDTLVHSRPDFISDGTNGDVASDSYNNIERDVEMLRELSVDFYRFSISWPRILPSGFTNSLNEPGLQYYEKLINELVKYNIEPFVTMYHYDLPQPLQDLGGWANPLSIDWFEDYARILFERYGDRVKRWITFNQPNEICIGGYGTGEMAPGISVKGIAEYMCVKNVLLANARVWRLYDKTFRSNQLGNIGIAIPINWLDPLNNSTENVLATEEFRQFSYGLYMNPIFSKEGDFPKVVKDIVATKSKEQGFKKSRLPNLTLEEISLIRGSADFLAMNHYTTFLVSRPKKTFEAPSFEDDANVKLSHAKLWADSVSPWLKKVPYGLYKACLYVNKHYDYPPMYITENGWSTEQGLQDQSRVDTLREYMEALLLAMEDGTDVKGYTYWSLMDNFEWTAGYSEHFGLYEVDFESPDKKRTARKSALIYKHIIKSRVVNRTYDPRSLNITVSNRRLRLLPKMEL